MQAGIGVCVAAPVRAHPLCTPQHVCLVTSLTRRDVLGVFVDVFVCVLVDVFVRVSVNVFVDVFVDACVDLIVDVFVRSELRVEAGAAAAGGVCRPWPLQLA